MMIALKKLFRSVSGFARERSGNVAITFAFASIPIIAFVGVAVDYSRANSMKAAMQTALDATALMLSKEASTDTQDQLRANAQKYFTALLNQPQAQNINVSVVYGTEGGSNIQITATGSLAAELIPTGWAHTLGLSGDFNLAARSTVRWGINRLRVALVLDNTGSMTDYNKIGALKTATAGLLTQLQGAVTTAGDVYVSIIPFVKDVNFGAPAAGWVEPDYIYWGTAAQDPGLTDNASWDAINGSCNNTNGSTYSTRNACVTRGTCSGGNHSSQSGCTSHGDCSVGGADISQTTCASSGTCSLTQYTSQSNCTSHGTCSNASYTTSSTCTSAGSCTISSKTSQSTCVAAFHCSIGTYTSQTSCQNNHGSWIAGVWTPFNYTWTAGSWTPATFTAYTFTPWAWTPNAHTTWNGCVADRGAPSGPDTTYNYDTNADVPDTTKPNSLYPAEQYGSCPKGVRGLSYDWAAMNTLVTNMTANGNTNQGIGLQVGWQSLVGGGPFTMPPLDTGYQYTQAIILMTDGLNTQDRWYSSQGSIDTRQSATCDNLRTAGIVVYTIQVNTGGDPTSTLLQNCASDPQKFYLLTDPNALTVTFNTIGTELTKLRVAQ